MKKNNIVKKVLEFNSNMSKYWIYTIKKNIWDDNKKILSTFEEIDVKNNDIIFVYLKNNCKNNGIGFVGIVKAKSDIKLNNKITYEYIVEVNILLLFDNLIKITNIGEHMKENKYFGSVNGFKSKYTNENLTFINVPNLLGKNLFKNLSSNRMEEDEIYESDVSDISYDSEGIDRDRERERERDREREKYSKGKTDILNILKNLDKEKKEEMLREKEEKKRKKDKDKEREKEREEKEREEKKKKIKKKDNSEKKYKNGGMVPIMFIPCEDFEEESKYDGDFIDQFKEHYLNCNNCEKNNNGTNDLNLHDDNLDIDYEVVDSYDKTFEVLLDGYYNGLSTQLLGKINNNTIRLYIVDDDSSEYDKCILIEWAVSK